MIGKNDSDSGVLAMRNLITDVEGLKVGNVDDDQLRSGVTVLLPDEPCIAAVDVRGGGPGTRDTEALGLLGSVDHVHAVVLSGGSAFGLGAATGVQSYLRQRGIGFEIGNARVPIVPQAILFDLLNGGDKNWGDTPPYEAMARRACELAEVSFELGSKGAGLGATTARFKGGLGSASAVCNGATIGALAAVNPVGCATIPGTTQFWAAPFEIDGEFGDLGMPDSFGPQHHVPMLKGGAQENTTLCVVATDAALDKRQAQRLAIMAQTGLALAVRPVHTPLDGDIVFALSTGARELSDPLFDLARLGACAAQTLARAIARGVYEAGNCDPNWSEPRHIRAIIQ